MRAIAVSNLQDGMYLSRPIYNENSVLLLNRGLRITQRYISRLKALGITIAFIEDEDTEDIEAYELISSQMRQKAGRNLKTMFDDVQRMSAGFGARSLDSVKESVQHPRFQEAFNGSPGLQSTIGYADDLVGSILEGDILLGLNSIKTCDNYTFQHSIDVTAIAIMIGRKVGLHRMKLEQLGIGCLLHDIGKIFVDDTIIKKPTRLTKEEYDLIKEHPRIGYELLRQLPSLDILTAHIAYQHHEKQNGTGYPRGIRGTNTLKRTTGGVVIHPYGAIAAVADIYDALTSDRPYRAAWPSDRVAAYLGMLGGVELNREVVSAFLSLLPVYPLGTGVSILSGVYTGFSGVVSQVTTGALDAPVIRVLFDSNKRRIEPFEIDLREEALKIKSTGL